MTRWRCWWQARGRQRDERGAMAVITAVLAVALFGASALAVDLGSAWARERAVQNQVDLAALAGGSLLPAPAGDALTVAARVADYLAENTTAGQPVPTAQDLVDGDTTDGEIRLSGDGGAPCTSVCTRLSVTSPHARVEFGLAGVLGAQDALVQRDATVQAFSQVPHAYDLVPFWLPSGCGFGPADADTEQGGAVTATSPSPTATASPTATTTTTPTTGTSPTATGSHTIGGGAPLSVAQHATFTMSSVHVYGVPSNADRTSLRFYAPDGTWFIDYAAFDVPPANSASIAVPPFSVGPEVTDTPGTWQIRALVRPHGANKAIEASSNALSLSVVAGASAPSASASPTTQPRSAPVGCVGQDRGNFGQLDSPRAAYGLNSTQTRLALNIAEGLDHSLEPFPAADPATVPKSCQTGSGTIAGAALDNESKDGRNCIRGDTGNDGPSLFDGFIAGTAGKPGRLSVDRPDGQTCGGRPNAFVAGHEINDDVLACFLRNGATADTIARASGVDPSMLDPAILDSPRFVWLPIVRATDRSQKSYQPIVTFTPAFITDETQSSPPTSANGVVANGNSLKVLRVFTFNRDALPPDLRSPVVQYSPSMGRPVVRLVD